VDRDARTPRRRALRSVATPAIAKRCRPRGPLKTPAKLARRDLTKPPRESDLRFASDSSVAALFLDRRVHRQQLGVYFHLPETAAKRADGADLVIELAIELFAGLRALIGRNQQRSLIK
jgi:hypothetical protein